MVNKQGESRKDKVMKLILETDSERSWNREHPELMDLIFKLEICNELKYELRNCRVGSYFCESILESEADLKEAVLCIAVQLTEIAERIK
tara:strand:- start:8 stop:277 length:270 start_codon:yes stop_codon:yes gene_type:complete